MSYLKQLYNFTPIANKLLLVEKELQCSINSDIPAIHEMANYISKSKGKRLRPALLLACSTLCGVDSDDEIKLATIFELIHTATLIHDDVIDNAMTRRGKLTLNAIWDNSRTVLFGDLLYTHSISKAVAIQSFQLLNILSNIATKMIEGELIQNKFLFNLNITKKEYFDIQERKTAFLFAGCAKSAGVLAQRPSCDCNLLYEFGLEIGRAFQLVDDLLDYTATSEQIGKPAFSDLKGGKLTLPLLMLLEKIPLKIKPIIERIWNANIHSPIQPNDKQTLYSLLEDYDALKETKAMAQKASVTANSILEKLQGDQTIKNLLLKSSESLLKRNF